MYLWDIMDVGNDGITSRINPMKIKGQTCSARNLDFWLIKIVPVANAIVANLIDLSLGESLKV